jgi:hypothetical protein
MKSVAWASCLLLAGCAAPGAGLVRSPEQLEAPAAASPSADVEVVEELDISEFADDHTVCRREAPLGSRIAVKRCYSTNAPPSARDAVNEQLALQDLETMRQRQMLLEQQRVSREAAMRVPMPPRQ